MKRLFLYILTGFLLPLTTTAQENHTLRGRVLYMNSGKTPAVGVKISGHIPEIGSANTNYTDSDGFYNLVFPRDAMGRRVNLDIGTMDSNGQAIEVVNKREVQITRVPAIFTDRFEIIVAKAGERDLIAEKYYRIIKTSAHEELEKMEERVAYKYAAQEKNYAELTILTARIENLRRQTDSITIYREAYRLASINKDNASERVVKYLELLEKGESVQEAREVLSNEAAAKELDTSIIQFNAAIEELETQAKASETLFEYEKAMLCYTTIISYLQEIPADRSEIIPYEQEIGRLAFKSEDYSTALHYRQRTLDTLLKLPETKASELAAAYTNVGSSHRALGQYKKALCAHKKAIALYKDSLGKGAAKIAGFYNALAITYRAMQRYEAALRHHKKALRIYENDPAFRQSHLVDAYHSIASTYFTLKRYKKALHYYQKAIALRERHPKQEQTSLGLNYSDIAATCAALENLPEAVAFQEKSLTAFKKDSLPETHPFRKQALGVLGLYYAKNRQFHKADSVVTIYEKRFSPDSGSARNRAVCYALQNNKTLAIKYLEEAVSRGYSDSRWLKTDASMDSLRKEKTFRELLKNIKQKRK